MTSLTPEHVDAALDLVDLIDAENPPQMYYVPDSKGFERRISRHIRANHQTLESALHDHTHWLPASVRYLPARVEL